MIDGIIALLKSDVKFEVIGQNISPLKAIEEIKIKQPDVLITDVNMKELSGIELAKKIKTFFPKIKILALSMHGDRETISEMIGVGINGYVLKNTGKEELTNALIKISNNELFFSEEVTSEMMKTSLEPKLNTQKEFVSLTPREKQIVNLIYLELNNSQISTELFISERTVETHRKNIFRKTQTKSVAGLIKFAIEQKIIKSF